MTTKDLGAAAPKGKPRVKFAKEPAFLLKLRGAIDTFLEVGDLDEWAVFWRLIFLSYYHGGPLADEDSIVAKHLQISARRWRPIKAKLIASEHLRVVDGMLIPKNVIERLEQRAQTRETAADDGRAGGHAKGQNQQQAKDEVIPFAAGSDANQPRTSAEPTGYDDQKRGNSRDYGVKNPSLVESGKVESEDIDIESDSTSVRANRDGAPDIDDEGEGAQDGVDASEIPVTSPSRAGEGPAPNPFANVVFPIGEITDRDPKTLHRLLSALAGPRLQDGDQLANSISEIATALLHGCDPNDMATVVVDRTHRQGKPIPSWRYFRDAWFDARDRKRVRAA